MSARRGGGAGSAGPVLLAMLTLVPTVPIAAQRQPPSQFRRYQAAFPTPPETLPDAHAPAAQDYRWTGVAVGAVSFGALGAWLGVGFCGMSDDTNQSCLGAAMTGLLSVGTIGAILGGVVGTGIKRATAPPPSDSLRLGPALAPPHEGMAIGAALLGGTFAALAGVRCALDQSTHEPCTGVVLRRGALGAFAGGLVGALVDAATPRASGAAPP
jgi:hypothetical protein